MSSSRKHNVVVAALGASALAGAALSASPASAAVSLPTDCVQQAIEMARPLLRTTHRAGSARVRGVADVIAKIKANSAACVDLLFKDGDSKYPNAGLLGGNGFSYNASNCAGVCTGGHGGRLIGNGGDGYNGGSGGNAGWYGGVAGDGGDAQRRRPQ